MGKQITRIVTDGYRGPGTHNVYLEPDEYAIGEALDLAGRVVPRELATYLVAIGKAIPTAFAADAPPADDTPAPEGDAETPTPSRKTRK